MLVNKVKSFLKACFCALIGLIALGQKVYGKNLLGDIDILWSRYAVEKKADSRNEILFEIAADYYKLNDFARCDSTYETLFEKAQNDRNDTLLIRAYSSYFHNELPFNKKSLSYATDMLSIAKNNKNDVWLYEAYSAMSGVYISFKDYDNALQKAETALNYADECQDEHLQGEGYLLLGICKENKNNKLDAFQHYMKATYLANKNDDDKLLFDSYERLSSFFRLLQNYPKAKFYKLKQLALLDKKNADSLELMTVNNDLSNILYRNQELERAEKINTAVMQYARQNNYTQLKDIAFAIKRNFLVANNLFSELSALYTRQYPDELEKVRLSNPGSYYRLRAMIDEANGQPDSALHYYQLAENTTRLESRDNVFIANFYKRYGQFALRVGNVQLAKTNFEQSYNYARQASYFPYVIDATQYLDSIYEAEKNFSLAYNYAKLNRLYSDSQVNAAKENELLLLEIDNENRQQDLWAEKEKKRIERKHNLQHIAIIIFISILFLLLLMLGSFKVRKTVVKSMNFFSFILLFEFIIMITDTKIEHYTHGEPWKILAFKLLIISCLAPLHHKLEHKLLEYLYEHDILETSKMKLRPLIGRLRKRIVSEKPKP